ncbi:MAG: hypothetical protein QNK40_05155, partial [Desulfobacterales bacterium]|nr:hypothetical protein [Desulfobacterales bacterium]MDX2508696.1 hypothetical protein [Desulfobacterales bacterium]
MDKNSKNHLFAGNNKHIAYLAKELGIKKNDADTLISEVFPMIKRKYDLLRQKSSLVAQNDKSIMQIILNDEVPVVFQNYALANLQNNEEILVMLINYISDQMSVSAAKQFIEKYFEQDEDTLVHRLAEEMGISKSYLKDFKAKIIPEIKKFTIAMYRKKLREQGGIDKADSFMQFVIDNIFIDEFENHPFVRSFTDKNNRAILPPKAGNIA